jgi:hypothetical protein
VTLCILQNANDALLRKISSPNLESELLDSLGKTGRCPGRFTCQVESGRVRCTQEGICYRCHLRNLISDAGTYSILSVFPKAENGVKHGD